MTLPCRNEAKQKQPSAKRKIRARWKFTSIERATAPVRVRVTLTLIKTVMSWGWWFDCVKLRRRKVRCFHKPPTLSMRLCHWCPSHPFCGMIGAHPPAPKVINRDLVFNHFQNFLWGNEKRRGREFESAAGRGRAVRRSLLWSDNSAGHRTRAKAGKINKFEKRERAW